jgi:hypothetical protein
MLLGATVAEITDSGANDERADELEALSYEECLAVPNPAWCVSSRPTSPDGG